jgi:hypothetical protein
VKLPAAITAIGAEIEWRCDGGRHRLLLGRVARFALANAQACPHEDLPTGIIMPQICKLPQENFASALR